MARAFDEERACNVYLARIDYWRKINQSITKHARVKSTKLEILTCQLMSLQAKSPEEESCILSIQKCKSYREKLSENYIKQC